MHLQQLLISQDGIDIGGLRVTDNLLAPDKQSFIPLQTGPVWIFKPTATEFTNLPAGCVIAVLTNRNGALPRPESRSCAPPYRRMFLYADYTGSLIEQSADGIFTLGLTTFNSISASLSLYLPDPTLVPQSSAGNPVFLDFISWGTALNNPLNIETFLTVTSPCVFFHGIDATTRAEATFWAPITEMGLADPPIAILADDWSPTQISYTMGELNQNADGTLKQVSITD